MPSFVTIIISCVSFILRYAFRLIGSREICQQASDRNPLTKKKKKKKKKNTAAVL